MAQEINLFSPEMWANLPPEITSRIESILSVVKTLGIIFIIYLLFFIVQSIFAIWRNRKIKKIYEKVEEIDGKLDKLLGKDKHKPRKSENKNNSNF